MLKYFCNSSRRGLWFISPMAHGAPPSIMLFWTSRCAKQLITLKRRFVVKAIIKRMHYRLCGFVVTPTRWKKFRSHQHIRSGPRQPSSYLKYWTLPHRSKKTALAIASVAPFAGLDMTAKTDSNPTLTVCSVSARFKYFLHIFWTKCYRIHTLSHSLTLSLAHTT